MRVDRRADGRRFSDRRRSIHMRAILPGGLARVTLRTRAFTDKGELACRVSHMPIVGPELRQGLRLRA